MKKANWIKGIAVALMAAMGIAICAGCTPAEENASSDGASSVASQGTTSQTSSEETSTDSSSEEESSSQPEQSQAEPSVSSSTSSSAPSVQMLTEKDETRTLTRFPEGSVAINGGIYKDTIDYWGKFFLDVPTDNILYEFRFNTGATDIPGTRLGGWSIQLKGYEANEWISGFCRLYAITGNEAYKTKALAILDGWWECFERKVNGLIWYNSHYAVKRWIDACMDTYIYLDDKDALDKLDQLYRFANRELSKGNLFGDNGSEWYTMSECCYQAYELTGQEKWKNLGKKFEYTEYWGFFADANNVTPFAKAPEAGMNSQHYHVISHVNSFNGVAELYRMTGETKYLNMMKNAFNWIWTAQMHTMGSIGAGLEWGMPVNEILMDLQNNHAHAETGANPCYSRFGRNLLELTGDAKVGDWLEMLNYNDLCALIKPKTEGVDSTFMSYHDFNFNGGSKEWGWRGEPIAWTSCAATIPLELAGIYESLYYYEGNNIHVNGYAPSTLTWKRNGNTVKLTQKTSYPENGKVDMTLSLTKAEEFSIRLRVPNWADQKKITITVNGEKVAVNVNKSGWAVLRKNWKNGDTISLNLPMELRADEFADSDYYTVMYGPLAMAFAAPDFKTVSDVDPTNVSALVSNGKTLEYKLSTNSKITLKPYYQYKQGETYYYYLYH